MPHLLLTNDTYSPNKVKLWISLLLIMSFSKKLFTSFGNIEVVKGNLYHIINYSCY